MNTKNNLTRERSKKEALFLVDSCVAKKRDPKSFTPVDQLRHAAYEARRQLRKALDSLDQILPDNNVEIDVAREMLETAFTQGLEDIRLQSRFELERN